MTRRTAVALATTSTELSPQPAPDLAGLRSRVGEATERDAVVIDFLEDDLHEARAALGAVGRYLGEVETALGDGRGGREQVLALALGRGPLERIEYLGGVVSNLRRRLAQLSGRLGP